MLVNFADEHGVKKIYMLRWRNWRLRDEGVVGSRLA